MGSNPISGSTVSSSRNGPDGADEPGTGPEAGPGDRLAALFAADTPNVAVSFTDHPDDLGRFDAAVRAGMDIAEARIDRFEVHAPDRVVTRVRRLARLPTIATIRSATEGGGWDGHWQDRVALFEAVLPEVDAVDVELSDPRVLVPVLERTHNQDRLVIGSFHDFERTPPVTELNRTLHRALDVGVDIVKVATMVHSSDDLRTLADLVVTHHDRGVIVIGMGTAGAPSRLLFPFLGSRLTFAASGEPSAPGQLPLDEMAATFRALSPGYAARHR